MCGQFQRQAGLRLFGAHRLVDDHDGQGLARCTRTDVPVNQKGGKLRRRQPARAGQAIPVHHEDLVRDGHQTFGSLKVIVMVKPADAGAVAVQQPGAMQDERAGADADQRHAKPGGLPQKLHRTGIEALDLADQAAHHGDIVELAGIAEAVLGRDPDPAGRFHRVGRSRQHPPATQDRARPVPLVRRQPQHIDEACKGAQREASRKDEAHPQAGRGQGFFGAGRMRHDANIQRLRRKSTGISQRPARHFRSFAA